MTERLAPAVGPRGPAPLLAGCAPPPDAEAVDRRREGRRPTTSTRSWPSPSSATRPISAVMMVGPDWTRLRSLQSGLQLAGLEVVDSYVSLTEVSEYAKGMPAEHLQARLHPVLPPGGEAGVLLLPHVQATGGRAQLVLPRLRGPSGPDDGPRPFRPTVRRADQPGDHRFDRARRLRVGRHPLRGAPPTIIKDCVYTMRFDEASAQYAEFGRFYVGIVGDITDVTAAVGLS